MSLTRLTCGHHYTKERGDGGCDDCTYEENMKALIDRLLGLLKEADSLLSQATWGYESQERDYIAWMEKKSKETVDE